MKVHLKLPEGQEAVVNLNLIPKTGEKIDFGGSRYLVVSVIHSIEAARTILELVRLSPEEIARCPKLTDALRYRTSEIRAYSPPSRSRLGR